MATVEAVYENGAFRPEGPITLAEGTRVELTIQSIVEKPSASELHPQSDKTLAELLAEIAAMPMEPFEGEPFSSEDHDKILYGEQGAR